jgi:hypothetical protein
MLRVALAVLFVSLKSMDACGCLVSRSACQEFEASNLVFIGTVESIRPVALDLSGTNVKDNRAFDSLTTEVSQTRDQSSLRTFQKRALDLLFDLSDTEKGRLQRATSIRELQTELTFLKSQGTEVQFKVQKLFRQKQDDDDDSDQGSKKKEEPKLDNDDRVTHLTVWNEAGDCGIPFEKGETYLVYATDDEETDHIATNICHRTVRVSDAGEDLSYLFFVEKGKAKALRLEGFVTSDFNQFALIKSDRFHYSEQVKSPFPNVTVELKSPTESRHSATDAGGRFLFDGLAEGDYSISVLSPEFPNRVHVLSGPTQVRVQNGKCTILPVLVLSTGSQ